jgi:hypothetical protein
MTTSIDDLRKEIQGHKGIVNLARKQFIPTGEELANLAWGRVSFAGIELTSEQVNSNFNDYLCELIDTEYQIYLECEERCINQGVLELVFAPDAVDKFPTIRKLVDNVLNVLRDTSYSELEKLTVISAQMRPFYKFVEQSFAQGRMSRAGGSSQYHLKRLLEIASYSGEFETQQILNGTVDFLFPSLEAWKFDRRRCVIVSMKRSLRERYKQVFEELGITGGMTVYLLVTETYEEASNDITKPKVKKLDQQNIYLVVRDEIKQKRFPTESNVIGFTKFINEELPNRRAQWSSLLRS